MTLYVMLRLTGCDGLICSLPDCNRLLQPATGRRGTDDKGLVFLMVNDSLDEPTAREMMTGRAAPLISSFKLSYYTVLNLLRRMEGSGAPSLPPRWRCLS